MKLAYAAPPLLMIGLSGVLVVDTRSMGLWSGFTPGPAFFPFLIAGFTTILAVLLLLQYRRLGAEDVVWPPRDILRTIALVYLALVGFVALAPFLGMLVASIVLLAFVMIVAFRQPIGGSLVAIAITSCLIYVIFVQWLSLPMPKGIFGL
jgi:hypothetical protein